jgi:ribosomal protein S27AE
MGLLEDMLKALDRVEIWKELQATPKRIESLEKRVADLEEKLGGKWPGDVCPYCGAQAFRLKVQGMHGQLERWECGECKQTADLRLDLISPAAMKQSPVWRGRR